MGAVFCWTNLAPSCILESEAIHIALRGSSLVDIDYYSGIRMKWQTMNF